MTDIQTTFADLGLNADILESLNGMGYVKPSPIQAECIPHLLAGRDVLGMAQTGSGKTAAFSLPLLHNIDPTVKAPQILVLAPTRELAVQVAEAVTEFSKHMRGLNVVALYGGQRYDVQLRALRQGPQVVVGTPGRLLDHLKRGTLDLLTCVAWCWMKQTKCCAWASSKTLKPSWRKFQPIIRPRCSLQPCLKRFVVSPNAS